MTALQSIHIDEETRGIASTLAHRVDELAQDVACAVRAEVDFYKSTRAVTDDDLLASCTENLRFALKSLEDGVAFDTSPAVTTGSRRAAAGIPLPAVMDAYRVASYRLWHAVVVLRDNVNHRPLCKITTGAAHIAFTLAARKKERSTS